MKKLCLIVLSAALTLGHCVAALGAIDSVSPWLTLPREQPLPKLTTTGHVDHEGARIWYAEVGKGSPVVLLHGGSASSDTWGNQVPALIASRHRVILVDSRGHGRSTLGELPLSYELMESDVIAVMDELHIDVAAVVGWSDGANIGLVMAMKHPSRLSALYAFGANMDTRPGSVKPDASTQPVLSELGPRLAQDFARVSPIPGGFAALNAAVRTMQAKQPDYTAAQLAAIRGPKIMISEGEHEEFITEAHTRYLAQTIPGACLVILRGVSHFAPWQAPEEFNRSVLSFLDGARNENVRCRASTRMQLPAERQISYQG